MEGKKTCKGLTMLRMKWFLCPECKTSFEELVNSDDLETPCKCGRVAPLHPDYRKQIHQDGAAYKNITWSQWQAGQS